MNRLIQGEASRIVSVLSEAVEEVQVLSEVPQNVDIDEELEDELRRIKSFAVLEHLLNLRDAEKRYAELMRRGGSVDQVNLATIATHDAVRQLCRALKNDGKALDVLTQRSHEVRVEEEKKCHHNEDDDEDDGLVMDLWQVAESLDSFKETIIDKLSTTVEQAQSQTEFYQNLKVRIRHYEDELELIKADMKKESQKETELEASKDTISKLWGAIEDVRTSYEREMNAIEKDKSEHKTEMNSTYGKSIAEALKQLDAFKDEFIKECDAHDETEEGLRKKLNRGLSEVNGIISQYDREMLAKRDEYDRLERLYKDESARLAVLEEHFRKVDRDLANEAEEERLIAEELAKIAALKKRDDDAAATIQAMYRGMATRQKLKKRKKKKSSKKKKKK